MLTVTIIALVAGLVVLLILPLLILLAAAGLHFIHTDPDLNHDREKRD